MLLTCTDWKEKFSKAAAVLQQHTDMLSKLDAETGDGDHGVTIGRMAHMMEDAVAQWKEGTSIQQFMEDLGWALMNINGGSAGPLWGTMIGGFAEGAGSGDTDEAVLKEMFHCALAAMDDVTTAKLGQKTMMDALIPACEAVQNGGGDVRALLEAAAEAAESGAAKTNDYIARFGRAKNLKEKAIGHRDPGAVSLSILLRSLAS